MAYTGGAAHVGRGALAAVLLAFAPSPLAAQTPAGTTITNIATLRADAKGLISSNAATLIVAERVDCMLALAHDVADAGAALVVLTNPGNGREAFVVVASAGAATTPRPVAVDDDGDGRFDPAHDHVLADGMTRVLAPGETIRLLVPLDDAARPSLTVTARAVTASGAPGTIIAEAGDGGGDAVVGPTGAAARLTIAIIAEVPPTIVESQAVVASDGSATSRRGSVVTYTIDTRFTSGSTAARVVNPVPINTAYLSGTLTLDGATIADAGRVADGRIVVPLGAVEAGSVHRIMFKAVIQ